MRRFSSFLLIFFLFLAGCAPHREQTPENTVNAFALKLPAVYRADLSLKECPTMSFVLTLRPDGLYFLRAERGASGADHVQTEVGVWKSNAKRSIIQLNSYDNAVLTLAVTRARRLRVLKVSGGIMPSLVRYEFVLTDTAPNYNDAVRMQGMYSRRPEGGIFRECMSGITFPVARGGETTKLERASLTALHGQEKSVFVALDVLSLRRGRGEGLVPVRFVHVDPARSCDGEESRIATITDNRWRLMEINGEQLEADSVKKAPFLKVKSRDSLIEGFAGCNRFSGTWSFTGDRFMFSRTAATRMACPVGMEVEDAFLRALDKTQNYQIRDGILALVDRHGKVLARLRHSGPVGPDWENLRSERKTSLPTPVLPDRGTGEPEDTSSTEAVQNIHFSIPTYDNEESLEQSRGGTYQPASGRPKTIHVRGYYRKDGTYVRPHRRSAPR